MDPEIAPWKAIALASIAVATGLVGIVTSLVRRAKPQGMTNGNKLLLDRLERLEQKIAKVSDDVVEQGHNIANLRGRLERKQ